MYISRKQFLSIAGTAAVTGILAGCGGQAPVSSAATSSASASSVASGATAVSGDLNIVHYLTETAKLNALDELVAGFNTEYPDVKVNVESTSMDNYQDVVKLKISTGDAPDIIFGSCKTYQELIESGNIEDLTDLDFTGRIAPGVLDNVKVNGKVYGIPLDEMANVVFYNKDIFEEVGLNVPTTYPEFIDVCKKLDEAGYAASAAGYQDTIALGANFYTIFYGAHYLECENYAAELMSGEKKAADYPSLAAAMTQWREIMQYQNDDQQTIDTDRAEQLFANGESGMIIIGTWGLGAIMDYNPDGNFGGFMFPSEDTADANAMPVATDDTWMVSKDAKNYDAAMAFCEYMTRQDVNAKWCSMSSQLSAIDGVTVDTLPAAAQDIATLLKTVNVANWISVGTFTGQYDTTWYNVLQDFALTTDMTVDEFCTELDNEFAAAGK